MTNHKDIIRMNANGFSVRAIANSLHCHRSIVSNFLKHAADEEIPIPLETDYSNAQLHELLYLSSTGLVPHLVELKWI